MKIIKQTWNFEDTIYSEVIYEKIESAGRTCWRSESKGDPKTFVKMLIAKGHESVLEHVNLTIRIITDRGMSHLIVRHRIASYSQESTQFCNYSKERFGNDIFFILPVQYYPLFEETNDGIAFKQFLSESPLKNRALLWWGLCRLSEQTYFGMIEQGATPQEARSSLITSVKTELICSMNLRSWRHFFKLRTSKADQLQIQELAGSMLKEFKNILPSVFEDINIDE